MKGVTVRRTERLKPGEISPNQRRYAQDYASVHKWDYTPSDRTTPARIVRVLSKYPMLAPCSGCGVEMMKKTANHKCPGCRKKPNEKRRMAKEKKTHGKQL